MEIAIEAIRHFPSPFLKFLECTPPETTMGGNIPLLSRQFQIQAFTAKQGTKLTIILTIIGGIGSLLDRVNSLRLTNKYSKHRQY